MNIEGFKFRRITNGFIVKHYVTVTGKDGTPQPKLAGEVFVPTEEALREYVNTILNQASSVGGS